MGYLEVRSEATEGKSEDPSRTLILAAVLCFCAFILLALAVHYGVTQRMDDRILRSLRGLVDRQGGRIWGEESVIAITSIGSVIILASLSCAVCGVLVITRKYHACFFLLAALLGALLLNYSLKPFFARERPTIVKHVQRVASPSFPSGHSLISTAVYGALGVVAANLARDVRLRNYFLALGTILPVIIGLSRIYLGVHFPSDVLGGWIMGLLWTILCWLALRRLQDHGEIEQPS